MEQVLACRSVSISELKRSPSAVLAQAGDEPVAVLNHNRPAAYLVAPHVYQSMLNGLSAELERAIQAGIESGQDVPAEEVFAELASRYQD